MFGKRLGLAEQYTQILAEEGIEWGLIGPREADRLWDRHIVNCTYVIPLIAEDAWVADIGSGAGLPGIPIALARPQCRVDLVEPMKRRVEFLGMCVERLGLTKQVRVVKASAQEYAAMLRRSMIRAASPMPEVVTCRAVKSVTGLIDLVKGLVPPAQLLSIKGEKAETEVAEAQDALRAHDLVAKVLRLRHEQKLDEVGTVVRISTNAQTTR